MYTPKSLFNTNTSEVKSTFNPIAIKDVIDIGLVGNQLTLYKKFDNPIEIINYGADIILKSSEIAQKAISEASNSDTKEINDKIVSIIAYAKGIEFTEKPNKLIDKLGSLFSSTKESILSKFTSLESKIDTIMFEIEQRLENAQSRINIYENMYQENIKLIKELETLCNDIKIVLQKKQDELNKMQSGSNLEQENIISFKENIELVERRLLNLETIKLSAIQSAPFIRMGKKNTIRCIEKFHNLKTLTIPGWKKSIHLYLQMQKDKSDIEIGNKIDDSSNEFIKKNAELLGQTSIQAAKSSNRNVIDIKTIEFVHNELINSFNSVMEIEKEGQIERQENIKKLSDLEKLYKSMGK